MTDRVIGRLLVKLGMDMSEFTKKMGEVSADLKDKSAEFQQLGIGLSASLTLPLVALATTSLTAFSGFESAMNKVSALGQITGKDLEMLNAQAIKLGASTQFSAKQAADAMGELAASGMNAKQVYDAMPGTMALAAAGQLGLGEAASIAASVMNGFGLQASDMNKVADILAQAAASSAISVQDLGNSFKFVGPIASAAGVSLTEVSAALAILGNAGIKGEMGGTAIRGMLSDLISPSNAAAKAMKQIGLEVMGLDGKILPMRELITRMNQADLAGKNMAAGFQIFGVRFSEVVPLLKAGTEEFDKMEKAMKDAEKTAAASNMAKTLMQGLPGALEKFSGALETLQINIGKALAPSMIELLKVGEKLLDWADSMAVGFTKLPQEVQTFAIAAVAAVAAIGPLLLALSTMTAVLGSAAAALPALTAALSGAGLAGTIAAATTAAVALGFAWKAWEIATLVGDIQDLHNAFNEWLAPVQEVKAAADGVNQAVDSTGKLLKDLKPTLDESAGSFTLFSDGIKLAKEAWSGFAAMFGENFLRNLTSPIAMMSDAVRRLTDDLNRLSGANNKAFSVAATANLKRAQDANFDLMRKQAEAAGGYQKSSVAAENAALNALKKAYEATQLTQKQMSNLNRERDQSAKAWEAAAKRMDGDIKLYEDIVRLNEKLKDSEYQLQMAKLKTAAVFKAAWDDLHKTIRQADVDAKSQFAALPKNIQEALKSSKELQATLAALEIPNGIIYNSIQLRDAADVAVLNYDRLTEAWRQGKISYDQYNAGYIEMTKRQIEAAKAMNESTTELEKNLERATNQTYDMGQAVTDVSAQATSELTPLWNQMSTIMTDFSNDIAESILGAKSLGEAWTNAMDAASKAVVRFATEYLGKQILSAIRGVFGETSKLGALFDNVFGTAASNAKKGADAVKQATTGVGNGAGNLGSFGSLATSVTAISGAVSAVSDVLQYLQGRRMEKDIARMEVTTREIKAELMNFRDDAWDREANQYRMVENIVSTLRYYGDAHGAYFSDMLGTLELLLLTGGAGGGGSVDRDTIAGIRGSAVDRITDLSNQAFLAAQVLAAAGNMGYDPDEVLIVGQSMQDMIGSYEAATVATEDLTDTLEKVGQTVSTTSVVLTEEMRKLKEEANKDNDAIGAGGAGEKWDAKPWFWSGGGADTAPNPWNGNVKPDTSYRDLAGNLRGGGGMTNTQANIFTGINDRLRRGENWDDLPEDIRKSLYEREIADGLKQQLQPWQVQVMKVYDRWGNEITQATQDYIDAIGESVPELKGAINAGGGTISGGLYYLAGTAQDSAGAMRGSISVLGSSIAAQTQAFTNTLSGAAAGLSNAGTTLADASSSISIGLSNMTGSFQEQLKKLLDLQTKVSDPNFVERQIRDLQNRMAASPTGANPGGSRPVGVLRNGVWVDPQTLLPVGGYSNTTTNLNLSVTATNSDSKRVANEMVDTWRANGVPI